MLPYMLLYSKVTTFWPSYCYKFNLNAIPQDLRLKGGTAGLYQCDSLAAHRSTIHHMLTTCQALKSCSTTQCCSCNLQYDVSAHDGA
jgi:hypothetical protein